MESSGSTEEYPYEIDEQLRSFDSSVTAVKTMLDKLMSMSRNELLQKVQSSFAFVLVSHSDVCLCVEAMWRQGGSRHFPRRCRTNPHLPLRISSTNVQKIRQKMSCRNV